MENRYRRYWLAFWRKFFRNDYSESKQKYVQEAKETRKTPILVRTDRHDNICSGIQFSVNTININEFIWKTEQMRLRRPYYEQIN